MTAIFRVLIALIVLMMVVISTKGINTQLNNIASLFGFGFIVFVLPVLFFLTRRRK